MTLTAISDPGEKALLASLRLRTDFDTVALITRTQEDGFIGETVKLETQTRQLVAGGRIENSLYLTAEDAGLPAATTVSLIRALSYRVDFQHEIRPGDSFRTLYQQREAADGSTQPSDIVYAELDLGDRVERLYQFTHPKTGRTDYFDQKGESMRRLLMRTPIDGARLTSSFGMRRHPILGYKKAHRGVDFGAPTGTPIYAAGDGVVERASWNGGYGKYIRVRHARGFKTAYAHMSRFGRGVKAGTRVRQGEVIGYVGSTGRSTGPHLHYEVIKAGKKVNPMRLDLPTGEVLSGPALTAFKARMAEIDEAMAQGAQIPVKFAQNVVVPPLSSATP